MDGFKKIELSSLNQKVKAITEPVSDKPMGRKKNKSRKLQKTALISITVIAVVIIVLFFAIGLPLQKVLVSAKQTQAQLKVFGQAVKGQNIDQAATELQKSQADLVDTQQKLNALSYLRFIPIASWYYGDADHLMKAGTYGLDTAKIIVESIQPYSDVLGLKGNGTFSGGTAQQRIATAVSTLDKITPKIDDISSNLVLVKKEVDQISKDHYPTLLFGNKISSQIDQLQTYTDDGVVAVDQARPLVTALPSLLGSKAPKKYLVIFQNDKELRPTGGFITSYTIFNVDKGSIRPEKSDDIYPLDSSIANKPAAPAPLIKYLHLTVPVLNLRDSNLSPDFIESMKTFQSLYERAGQSEKVDGIIAMDTSVLVNTIHILDGEIYAGGIKFTDQNDPRCDCPQVIYELENEISRPVNYVKTARKSLLGDLLASLLQKSLQSSPKKYWGHLLQDVLINGTAQKHILFDLYDKDAQSGLEALNAAGQIHAFDGDYLHINDSNLGGDKGNLFTTEKVEDKFDVGGDGTITKTVTISYANNHAPSDCNLERGGLCLNSDIRDWLRVYVPKGSVLIDSKGSEVKVTTQDELGKTMFDGFLTIRPMHKATYTLTYKLPFKLQNGSILPVLIQKQPGTYDNTYTIIYNNRTVDTFPLLTDKELKLK